MPDIKTRPFATAELAWPSLPTDHECPCCAHLLDLLQRWRPVLEEGLRKVRDLDEHVRLEGTMKLRGIPISETDPSDGQRLTYTASTNTYDPETPTT